MFRPASSTVIKWVRRLVSYSASSTYTPKLCDVDGAIAFEQNAKILLRNNHVSKVSFNSIQ